MSDIVYIDSRTDVVSLEVTQDVVTIDTADGRIGPSGLSINTLGIAGVVTVQTGKGRWYAPRSLVLSQVRASVDTAPTGASLIVVVRRNGTSIATVTIPAGQNTATTSPAVTLAAGDYLQVDVTQVGSSVAGSDLTVQIEL